MTFAVSFGASLGAKSWSSRHSSDVPIAAFAALRQDDPAKYPAWPRLLPNAKVNRALDNCVEVLDHSLRGTRDIGRRI
jgi:hypothetical protein